MTKFFVKLRLLQCVVAVFLSMLYSEKTLAESSTTQRSDAVVASVTPETAMLENSGIRITYDLHRGVYSVVNKRQGLNGITDAFERVGDWISTDPGSTHAADIEPTQDELGIGKRLLITTRRQGAPTLLLELSLYDGQSFVVLRGGLENNTDQPIRLKGYHPLSDGAVFSGGEWTDVRTLDGMSSAHQSRVSHNALLSSANNLLLTFKQGGTRRALVLGALKTEQFTKWTHTLSGGGMNARAEEIAKAFPGSKLVSYFDCGRLDTSLPAGQIALHTVAGETFTYNIQQDNARFANVLFENHRIIVQGDGLDPHKRYALGWLWWDYDGQGRVETVNVSSAKGEETLVANRPLPAYREKNQPPEQIAAVLPSDSYRDGSFRAFFEKNGSSDFANAVVNEVWLLELPDDAPMADTWKGGRPVPAFETPADGADQQVTADLEAFDPLGRLIRVGERYLPADSFYLNFTTPNPFEALEQYGKTLALATGAHPDPYDFPTVCAWYAGVWKTPKVAQDQPWNSKYKINTTPGMVQEMQSLKERGVLDYSRVAVRLVPDTYHALNPQGWWNDAHWKSGGYYVAPYDTSQKFGHAVQSLGGLAFTYFQLDCIALGMNVETAHQGKGSALSADFKNSHRSLLIGDDVSKTLDYTKPQTQSYMRSVFASMRGAISGIMFDYCDDFWIGDASKGGFADSRATATSFYRMPFELAKNGLGPQSWIHERNLGRPNNDLTLGYVDLQRTSTDTDRITPDMVSRSGLRWYKNRVVINYDMDSKDMNSSWKVDGYNGSDRDGRRMMLTMAYTAASRLLLANSFRDLDDETLHDLERVIPFPTEHRSARPIDAFVAEDWPRVYDFAVNPSWHELTLYNNALPTQPQTLTIPLVGDAVDGALGLDPKSEYYVYDFWNDQFVGRQKGSQPLIQALRPGEARVLSLHKVENHPQFLSTNRHVMQGYLDLVEYPAWDDAARELHGASKVVGGETYRMVIALNGRRISNCSADGAQAQCKVSQTDPNLADLEIQSSTTADVKWKIKFE